MFNFIKRFKQIGGYEPIQTLLLGEFAYEEIRQPSSDGDIKTQKKRQNVSILLEFFETNSAHIVVKTYDKEERFHLLKKPFNFDLFSVEVENVNSRKRYLFVKENNICAFLDNSNDSARVFLIN